MRLEDLRIGDGALVSVGLYRFNQLRHTAQRTDYSLVALIEKVSQGPQIRPRSVTALRSSASSAVDLSIRLREKSLMSRPCTMLQSPPEVVTGNDEINPSGTPYEPSEMTAIDTQSSAGVPSSQSRAASTVADAAEAAEELPRASMIAAPRLATVGMESSAIHFSSLTTSAAFLPSISAWKISGYWVAEWLPQMATFLMSVTLAPVFLASCEMARLWSSRVSAENRSLGMSGALFSAISALVLAGLPVTPMRTSSAATEFSALPCAVKIAPFASSRSPRSMPGPRGRAPTSNARFTPSKILFGSAPICTPDSSGNAQSSSSITTPSSALRAGSISSSRSSIGRAGPRSGPAARRKSRLARDRAGGPQPRAAGQAKQQAVADLAGGTGDGNLQGCCAHVNSLLGWRSAE